MKDGRYKVLLVIVDPDSNEVLLKNTADAVTSDFAGGLSATGEEWIDTAKRLLKEQFDVEGDAVGISFVRREAVTSACKSNPTCWNTYVVLCKWYDCFNYVDAGYYWLDASEIDLTYVGAQSYLYIQEALGVLEFETKENKVC